MSINLTGKWKGQFTYGENYPDSIKGVSVNFYIDCMDDCGSLTGTFYDDESKHLFNELGRFYGYIENDFISFIQSYPCFYGFDQNNHIYSISDTQSQQILYEGILTNDKFSGTWEMDSLQKNNDEQKFTISSYGTWTMIRDEK
ncbi:MAG: hypothetical protein KA319_12555 [Ferruginibacter sp.]|nr:hypothetical protein [Ferruginibacter sp.]